MYGQLSLNSDFQIDFDLRGWDVEFGLRLVNNISTEFIRVHVFIVND